MSTTTAHGYTYDETLTTSPVTLAQLREVEASVLWSAEDAAALRRAGEILVPQTDAILDVWYGFVGATPHLVETFAGPDGEDRKSTRLNSSHVKISYAVF